MVRGRFLASSSARFAPANWSVEASRAPSFRALSSLSPVDFPDRARASSLNIWLCFVLTEAPRPLEIAYSPAGDCGRGRVAADFSGTELCVTAVESEGTGAGGTLFCAILLSLSGRLGRGEV